MRGYENTKPSEPKRQPRQFTPDDMRAILRCHRRRHSIAHDLRLSPRVLAELIWFEASLFLRELLLEYYVDMLADVLEDRYEDCRDFRKAPMQLRGRGNYLEGYLRAMLSKFLKDAPPRPGEAIGGNVAHSARNSRCKNQAVASRLGVAALNTRWPRETCVRAGLRGLHAVGERRSHGGITGLDS